MSEEKNRERSETYDLVTFYLVALQIAILHFTYDEDIQYRTITTKITKADKSTNHPHRDDTNSKTQRLHTGRQDNDF